MGGGVEEDRCQRVAGSMRCFPRPVTRTQAPSLGPLDPEQDSEAGQEKETSLPLHFPSLMQEGKNQAHYRYYHAALHISKSFIIAN